MTWRAIPLVVALTVAVVVPGLAAQAASQPQTVKDNTWPPSGVLRITQGIQSPQIVKEAKPHYTAEAMRAQIQGVVEVEAIILADGKVGEVRVVRSLDKEFGLDEQAVNAVKQWEFKPARAKDGQAIPVLVNIELTFSTRKR